MPRLKQGGSFEVWMYFHDHNPPHVHVIGSGGDFEAWVAIENGAVFAGHLPSTVRREALDWIAARRAELLKKWADWH